MGRLVFSRPPIKLTPEVKNTAIAHLPSDRIEQFYIQDSEQHVHRLDAQTTAAIKEDYSTLDFQDAGDLADLAQVTDYSIKTFPQFGSYGCFTITQNGTTKSIVRIKF